MLASGFGLPPKQTPIHAATVLNLPAILPVPHPPRTHLFMGAEHDAPAHKIPFFQFTGLARL